MSGWVDGWMGGWVDEGVGRREKGEGVDGSFIKGKNGILRDKRR